MTRSVVMVLMLAAIAVVAPTLVAAAPLDPPHVGLVPEAPRVDLPQIIDGDVLDVAVVGPYIVAGGDFTTIENNDGSTFSQPYLAAFDIDTGEFVDSFRPVLNGDVSAVEPGLNPDEVFIGGSFTNISGVNRNRFAELSLVDGTATTFKSNAAGRVQEIFLSPEGRLFVGGTFNKIKGVTINRVAEIDPVTGVPNPAFSFTFSGEGGTHSGGQNIKHLQTIDNGTRLLVVHTAQFIDGNERLAAAIFDIADPAAPTLTDYSINDFFDGAPRGALPTDADVSPDGSYFAMSTIIGWVEPWHDAVIAFPTTGGADTAPLWDHVMRDSVYAIAISNNAVYAGGHFCRIKSGPGPTDEIGNGFDDKSCTGSGTPGAWRWQLAALDPADGTPLDWDPGSNSGHGVVTLEATERGLLMGHDGTFAGSRYVGRMAFFDFGAGTLDMEAPTVGIDTPTAGSIAQSPVTVTGTTADNIRTEKVKLRFINQATGEFLQADEVTFAATLHEFEIIPPIVGGTQTAVWSRTFAAPVDQYRIEARAVDGADNVSVSAQVVFDIVGDPTCGVAFDVDGQPVISWDPVPGEDKYFVRRDGGFLATVDNFGTSYTDTSAAPGTHTYEVRSFQSNGSTFLDCGSITIDEPPAPTCSVSLDGLGQPVLVWDAIPGEDKYYVRRDGGFLATVSGGGLTYTDTTASAGVHTYLVRSSQGGVTTNVDCGSVTV